MQRMRITELGRSRLYLTRNMWASDDEVYIEPQCVDAARELGYVEDIHAEPAAPMTRRRGRPPKAQAESKSDSLAEKTVPALREMAEEKGIDLPSGYVTHDKLVEIIQDAETDQGDEWPKSNVDAE